MSRGEKMRANWEEKSIGKRMSEEEEEEWRVFCEWLSFSFSFCSNENWMPNFYLRR